MSCVASLSYFWVDFALNLWHYLSVDCHVLRRWCVLLDLRQVDFLFSQGNKGGLAIACKIYGRTICFTNLHLAAHLQCNEERVAQFDSILNDLELNGLHPILNHEWGLPLCSVQLLINTSLLRSVVFLAGDMNFRVDSLSLEEIKTYINKSQYNELLSNDQVSIYICIVYLFD